MRKILGKIARIPVIGYPMQLSSSLLRLPRKLHAIRHAIHVANMTTQQLADKTNASNERILQLIEQNKAFDAKLENYAGVMSDLRHQISLQRGKSTQETRESKNSADGRKHTLADSHQLDDFYMKFEEKFRGDEHIVRERLGMYMPLLKKRKSSLGKSVFLDIGCGRGEFLALLQENDMPVKGLDLNGAMVKRARAKGFDVEEADAMSFLKQQKANSFSGISGFHIVEHIPFDELMDIFNECFRTIKSDGVVIFETPNPENLTVGALNFYYDPSYLKPIPPQLLAFCLEYIGFKDVKIMPLRPEAESIEHENRFIAESLKRIFGPQEYAVSGVKP